MKTKQPALIMMVGLVAMILFGCSDSSGPGSDGGRQGSVEISGDEVRLKGFIESKGTSQLTVYGWTVIVDDNTEIRGDHGDPLAFSDLVIGTWVEVEGLLRGSTTTLAERIDVETRDDSDDFSGADGSIGSND